MSKRLSDEEKQLLKFQIAKDVRSEIKQDVANELENALSKVPRTTWKDIMGTIQWKEWIYILTAAILYAKGCDLVSSAYNGLTGRTDTVKTKIDSLQNNINIQGQRLDQRIDSIRLTLQNADTISRNRPLHE